MSLFSIDLVKCYHRKTGGSLSASCLENLCFVKGDTMGTLFQDLNRTHWNVLFATCFAWTLNGVDVMSFMMVMRPIMAEFGVSPAVAGFMASISLITAFIGGTFSGLFADKYGRKPTFMLNVAIFTTALVLVAMGSSPAELLIGRAILGIGFGGTYSAIQPLLNETWPGQHRGKGAAIMQSGFGIGSALAAALAGLVVPVWGWRALFWAGVIPGYFLLIWVWLTIPESPVWKENREALLKAREEQKSLKAAAYKELIQGKLLRYSLLTLFFFSFIQMGFGGFFTWLPTYLGSPADSGGAGLSIYKSSAFMTFMQVGGITGLWCFGFLIDKWGRRPCFITFLLLATVLLVSFANIRQEWVLFWLGPVASFFGRGYYGGFGALMSELYPTRLRATAIGVIYSTARATGALSPVLIGAAAVKYGFGAAMSGAGVCFVLAAIIVYFLPETLGRDLTQEND